MLRKDKHTHGQPPGDEEARLRRLLAASAGRFDPYFATRVMARVRALPADEPWFAGLYLSFRRVAIAGTIAVAMLLSYNVAVNWQTARGNALELALSIPPATVATSIHYLDLTQ